MPTIAVAETRQATPAPRSELQKIVASVVPLGCVIVVLWILFYIAWSRLPFIREGSDIVYEAKEATVRSAPLFNNSQPRRILIFGNSKVLAGFLPLLFEKRVSASSAYNLGLPNAEHFIPELQLLLQRGQRPTHVLITVPWEEPHRTKPSFFHIVPDDSRVITALFPFRHFIHDGTIFLFRSPAFGGPADLYRYGEKVVAQMQRDKGYYFIAEQSHYPHDHLPASAHLDSDSSTQSFTRSVTDQGSSFAKLMSLAKQYGFVLYFVPTYFRVGEYASPAANRQALAIAERFPQSFRVLGPEYYLYQPVYFSDFVHLNPTGARQYTEQLAALVNAELSR
jgi:hypothetical protein